MSRNADAQLHATNLDYSLRELARRVQEHERELEQLRAAQAGAAMTPTAQAQVARAALDEVTDSEPFLPFAGSLLPALLALRKTHRTIVESREYRAAQGLELDAARRQLEADQASFQDQSLLTDALEARIRALREELASGAAPSPGDGARVRLEELRRRKRAYDQDTRKLMRGLNRFIDRHLGPMLAAEELGGPVVGDMPDVDAASLAAGFTNQGKPRKIRDGDAQRQDLRQRRIDEIWSASGGGPAAAAEQDGEAAAAGAEMKQLTEELLNRAMEACGNSSASFLGLPRESAAARFLVRSKVAQFHPKDATLLRLMDFGRDVEE